MKRKHRILVVDDELTIRDLLNSLLSSHGYEVLSAQNAREALKLIEKRKLDLILLDINMPKISGDDVLGYLRARERIGELGRLPVIIISGVLTKHLVPRLIQRGADGVIVKPLNLGRVLKEIEEILGTDRDDTKPSGRKERTLKDILKDPSLGDVDPLVSRLKELSGQIEELDRELGEEPEDEGLMCETMSADDYARKIHKLHLGLERKQLREEYQEINAALNKIEQALRGIRGVFREE